MIKIKLLTLFLTGLLGAGGLAVASQHWHRFNAPPFSSGGLCGGD
jgi:hypothetical protein